MDLRGTSLLRSLVVLGALAAAAPARADAPAPDGTRYAGYGFRVDNVEAFADYVVLAYPVSTSNGAPYTGYEEATPGVVIQVGRRGGRPDLYAMRRADYTAWKATYTDKGGVMEDPQLEALFTGGKPIKCSASVSPRHTLPASAPPGEILDVFRVEAIDDSRCSVVAVSSSDRAGSANPAAPAAPATPPASGCRVAGETQAAGLLVVLLGLRRARRRG